MKRKIRFSDHQNEFYPTLKKAVKNYFNDKNLSRYGNKNLVYKAVFLTSAFLIPYLFILFTPVSIVLALLLVVIMGVAKAGIGMAVMHDAMHGTLSEKSWINNLFSNTIYLLGGNRINWHIQHNLYHHTYPSIYKVDEDINTKGFLVRLSPESQLRKSYRYQHLYVPFLYGFMTLSFLFKDFRQLRGYIKEGDIKRMRLNPGTEFSKLVIIKIVYFATFLVLPTFLTTFSFLQVLIGFFLMHFVAGLILSMIFQLAHIVESAETPKIDDRGEVESSWAAHQLRTTANFATKNKILSWFSGGLNFQVEHHLFPHVCHIHYPELSKIVEKLAKEFELPYNCYSTFSGAANSHFRMLKKLGRA